MKSPRDVLAELCAGGRILALTGAGISTDSGVPDYRGSGQPLAPSIEFGDFVTSPALRGYLWERNEQSWRLLQGIEPTPGHLALARLEEAGLVTGVATQNVDRLHYRAGTRALAELHGRFDKVVCLGCRQRLARERMSQLIVELNPEATFPTRHLAQLEILPPRDDAAAAACRLKVPPCPHCGGMLKPDVTFFGEGLPEEAFETAQHWAQISDVILAVGTSLQVSTAMYVLQEARACGARVVIVNKGHTAADHLADLRLAEGASEVLSALASSLT